MKIFRLELPSDFVWGQRLRSWGLISSHVPTIIILIIIHNFLFLFMQIWIKLCTFIYLFIKIRTNHNHLHEHHHNHHVPGTLVPSHHICEATSTCQTIHYGTFPLAYIHLRRWVALWPFIWHDPVRILFWYIHIVCRCHDGTMTDRIKWYVFLW